MADTSTYPGAIDTFTDKEAKKDKASFHDINKVQNCIRAVELTLGVNPQGSQTDLVTYLLRSLNTAGGMRKGTSFPGSPAEGDFFYRTDLDLCYIYDGSGWDGFGDPADASISQAKLKTTTGEVSGTGSATPDVRINENADPGSTYLTRIWLELAHFTLPGGEYGFYPQIKQTTAYGPVYTLYAQQRYVQSSGLDPWIFLLMDDLGKIRGSWYSPDHPSYGQGGDEKDIPHPFADYHNRPLPTGWKIVLVDAKSHSNLFSEVIYKNTIDGQKVPDDKAKLAPKRKGVLEVLNENYVVDEGKSGLYVPRDIADYTGEHKDVAEEDIPNYIEVKELIKL